MAKDSSVEIDAMRLTMEADDATSPTAETRNYEIATYLCTTQMSDAAYKALGLLPEAKAASEAAEETEDVEEKQEAINEKPLETAMEKGLAGDLDYQTAMLAKSKTQFDEADKVFKKDRKQTKREINSIWSRLSSPSFCFSAASFKFFETIRCAGRFWESVRSYSPQPPSTW